MARFTRSSRRCVSIPLRSWWLSATEESCRTCCVSCCGSRHRTMAGGRSPSMIAASITSADVKREAAAAGFDLCGIAPAANHVELRFLREWIDRGYAGDMQYLEASFERRTDVRRVLPSARTVISLGTVYNTARPYSSESVSGDRAAIARYAWGDDYHTVLEARLDGLVASLRAAAG